jgi:aspartyl-tRNA(Asn)/glutamyl-tRNA(Gln) amidotransferase subunit A
MGSLGSDTGGSTRRPASHCGVVGLKPTYGRVSRFGLIPLSWSQDHCGVITRTVEDAAFLLEAIAGHDPKDPTTSRLKVPRYSEALREDLQGITIGVPRHLWSSTGVNPEVVAALEVALKELEMVGAQLREVEVPSLDYAHIANLTIILGDAFTSLGRYLQEQPQRIGEITRTRLYMGGFVTARDYVQAQRARSRIRREFSQAMHGLHALVTPTMLNPAPTFKVHDPVQEVFTPSFPPPFNLTGMPAISIPCGLSSGGLPIGMQVSAKPFDESTVLRVAYAYQERARWFQRRPPI